MAETYRLRIYGDDGTTVAAEFSTDPVATHPDLLIPESLVEHTLDFEHGSARIQGCSVEVIDVPTDPADQDTGFFTSLLAGADGQTALIGRRAHIEVLVGVTYENILNGVISDIELHDSFSSYVIRIKDQRENERRIRAFVRGDTSTVQPRGVIGGFGYNEKANTFLINPTEHMTAHYTEFGGGTIGLIKYATPNKDSKGNYLPPIHLVINKGMREAFKPNEEGVYDKVRLLWRDIGDVFYNEVRFLEYHTGARPKGETMPGIFRNSEGDLQVEWTESFIFRWPAGATTPIPDSDIELMWAADGEPTETYPLHIEFKTFGELLQDLYDGVYSDPGVTVNPLYDSTAVLALNRPVRARITAPLNDEDGIWRWVEENIFAPNGAAPALDSQGLISPVLYELPDIAITLAQVDDTNAEPGAGWTHGDSDAINVVSLSYQRCFAVTPEDDPTGERSAGDGISVHEVEVQEKDIASIAFLGERTLEFKPVTLVAIGGNEKNPMTGDVIDELGAQLAALRSRQALDRFVMGGQHFQRRVLRSDFPGLKEGDWLLEATSWTPDYATGQRGSNRLAQVVGLLPIDSTAFDVHLVDAGPDNTPIGQPTLGTVVIDSDGFVSVPVTSVPSGGEARVDYNIADSSPSHSDGGWRFAKPRLDAPGTVVTPAVPAGSTVWVRGRGEAPMRRASAWTTPVSAVHADVPMVLAAKVIIDQDTGAALITWTPNQFALGLTIAYGIGEDPAVFTSVDVAASAGSYSLADGTVAIGETLTVDLTPYTGWTGSAVSGTAGTVVRARDTRAGTGAGTAGVAEVITLTLTEPNDNVLDVAVELVNTKLWHSWERLGAWPTFDNTPEGLLDPTYNRTINNPDNVRSYQHSADTGTWYVIILPYNANGQVGIRATGSLAITGSATGEGVLTGVSAEYHAGTDTIQLAWATNGAVDAGSRYEVTIERDGVTQVGGRNARIDPDNSDPGTSSYGGWRDSGVTLCTGPPGSCTYQTFEYRITLVDTLTTYPDKVYTTNVSGYFDA